ncbi:glycosyltransferase family 2 protein [Candidatus Uhrbacteria bacterium]|nr:glycosyltransferase family 2 protein [Candidatus Uhrbacteria bacterium]
MRDDHLYGLSIIIPSYNEEKRLGSTLRAVQHYVEENKINAEIIVVDDGSTDRTCDVVKACQKSTPYLSLVQLGTNKGKGAAVKKGVAVARGEFILFTDADNSTPIQELRKLTDALHASGADIIIGSRYLKDDSVKIMQPTYRVCLGRFGNFLIRTFLLDGISDTQCGFKLFRSRVAKDIFSLQRVHRFGFDMEVLMIAKHHGYTILEVPVHWFNSADSRLRPLRDSLITLKDLVSTKFNCLLGRYNKN